MCSCHNPKLAENRAPIGAFRQARVAPPVVLAALLLSACAPILPRTDFGRPEEFPCQRFGGKFWQEFRLGEDTIENAIATAMRVWEIGRDEIELNRFPKSGDSWMLWRTDVGEGPRTYFTAAFLGSNRLTRISMNWDLPEPAIAQVIDCMGPPDHYVAYYYDSESGPVQEIGYSLSLWYTDIGFIIGGNAERLWSVGRLPEVVPSGFRMDTATILPPGMEEMVRERHSYGEDDEGNRIPCFLKPWQGSIASIEIEESLENLCPASVFA